MRRGETGRDKESRWDGWMLHAYTFYIYGDTTDAQSSITSPSGITHPK